ncbi:S-layer homology domain-containing protein [Crassaminicella profunda]|uniref:S-layer homology domain-containing protein n=1 Tax=Crassaminicella profunda TaxID=1286698 RepID=UPI001CA62ECD|nr:S-layer homology domain-containing protein [Crassaminicella profunda]QZY55267.1 S-layer homology domain-containing protein [Crassaminicella profunda]
MKKFFVQGMSILFCLLMMTISVAANSTINDLEGHWAKAYVEKLIDEKIISGYDNNTIRPNQTITRAEFITTINKIFDYKKKDALNFKDVSGSEWYAGEMAKAKIAGIINGYQDGTVHPNEPIKREEAAILLYKAFQLENVMPMRSFADADHFSSWSKDAIYTLKEKNIISGYNDKTFHPKSLISRAEAFTMIAKLSGDIIQEDIERKTFKNNVILNKGDIQLKNIIIEKDLYLSEGIEKGTITLEGVKVKGKVYLNCSSKDEISLMDSEIKKIKLNQPATLKISKNTMIEKIEVNSKDCHIVGNGVIKEINAKEKIKIKKSSSGGSGGLSSSTRKSSNKDTVENKDTTSSEEEECKTDKEIVDDQAKKKDAEKKKDKEKKEEEKKDTAENKDTTSSKEENGKTDKESVDDQAKKEDVEKKEDKEKKEAEKKDKVENKEITPSKEEKSKTDKEIVDEKAKKEEVKKDIQPPKIILKGENHVTIRQGENYVELGIKAVIDDCDTDLLTKVMIQSNVDENRVGSYVMEYSVRDQAGNLGKAVRTVTVIEKLPSTVYEQIKKALENFDEEVIFTGCEEIDYNEVWMTLGQVIDDDPRLEFTRFLFTNGRYEQQAKKLVFGYTVPRVQLKNRLERIDVRIDAIIKQVIKPDMDDFQKEKAIHDYVVSHVEYDYENYKNNTVPLVSHQLEGGLLYNRAVCDGYSKMMKALLDKVGIESMIISGNMKDTGGAHAWNLVKLGGDYYHVDATHDDPVSARKDDGASQSNKIYYTYFNVTDDFMKDTRRWKTSEYPVANSKTYNYYEYYGLMVHSKEEFKKRVKEAVVNKQKEINLYSDVKIDGSDIAQALKEAKYYGSYNYPDKPTHNVLIKLNF